VNVGQRFAWVRAVIAAEPRATLAEVAVAAVLAEHYNAERGAAWPAQQTIAALTRMDRRNVRRALASLEQRDLIARISNGGPRSSTRFALVLPSDGAAQHHQKAPHSAISGRSPAPSDGAPQRPEQVSRSESVGKPYPAAVARAAAAPRARGGLKPSRKNINRQPGASTPVRL
jgi:hypothetical protein